MWSQPAQTCPEEMFFLQVSARAVFAFVIQILILSYPKSLCSLPSPLVSWNKFSVTRTYKESSWHSSTALFDTFILMSCYRSLATMLGVVVRFLEKCPNFLLVIMKLKIMLISLLTILIHGSQP